MLPCYDFRWQCGVYTSSIHLCCSSIECPTEGRGDIENGFWKMGAYVNTLNTVVERYRCMCVHFLSTWAWLTQVPPELSMLSMTTAWQIFLQFFRQLAQNLVTWKCVAGMSSNKLRTHDISLSWIHCIFLCQILTALIGLCWYSLNLGLYKIRTTFSSCLLWTDCQEKLTRLE